MGHYGVVEEVRWALVVTSDAVKQGRRRDEVTPLVMKLLGRAGHRLVYHTVVGNNEAEIQYRVLQAIVEAKADVVLVTGGTGPRPRDVSVDAVEKLATRSLPGLGELFRRLSAESIGLRAYLSRASAYIVHGSLVVVSPGSPQAVELMLEKVLLPVVGHIVYELRRS